MFAPNASTPAAKVDGGWRGVLYANLALLDPKASWEFFAQDDFDYSWIDGGATRTWYLAFAAGSFSSIATKCQRLTLCQVSVAALRNSFRNLFRRWWAFRYPWRYIS